jgi:hypothetical protein
LAGLIANPLTSLTASILFDGNKIGELQEITVEEDFAIKPIESIGSSYIVDFLPGTSTGRIIARRALLESDLFFDRLTPGVVASSGIAQITNNITGGLVDISSTLKTVEGISDFWNTVFSNKSTNDRFNFVLYFDIELINNNNVVFAKFEKCVLRSRSLSVNLGNVVIMHDITCLFQKRSI